MDSRLLLSPAPSHQKLHQVVASWESHSASSTSSVYSSFNHYTELLQSICEIAALQLSLPRPGYDCNHLSGLIYVCGG